MTKIQFEKLDFYHKRNGLEEIPPKDYFTKSITKEEIEKFPDIKKLYPEFLYENFKISSKLFLPDEYLELLKYSNGGGITNGNREFGFFGLEEIRYYFFAYGFPKWTPDFLPIALNGGGVFYAYDFRDLENVQIVAVEANNLDYESAVSLGKNLKEILSETTNIEGELSQNNFTNFNETQEKLVQLHEKLSSLKSQKEENIIPLKDYLTQKREIEEEIKLLKE